MRLFLKNSCKFTQKERNKLLFSEKRVIDLYDDVEEKKEELDNSLTAQKLLRN